MRSNSRNILADRVQGDLLFTVMPLRSAKNYQESFSLPDLYNCLIRYNENDRKLLRLAMDEARCNEEMQPLMLFSVYILNEMDASRSESSHYTR